MAGERFRILAIDDDRDTLDLIHMTLSDGYEVLTLHDAIDACEILEFMEPDLVVVDIMMPKITGFQIVEFLKKTPKFQNTIVVFLSAKDSSRDIKYAYKIGANFYLVKPFQPERLLKNIEMLLESSGGKPSRKSCTMRDVTLRLQTKMGLRVPDQIAAARTDAPAPGLKLKRSLEQETEQNRDPDEQDDGPKTKWVG